MPKAFITGASGGIGAEFARQLAAENFNLVLTSRRKERLDELAAELVRKYSVSVEVLPADLSKDGDVNALVDYIMAGPPLDMLINNAGFGAPGEFHEAGIEKHLRMTDVHITAMLRLTNAALPGMLKADSGAVINVSSVASFIPTPGGSTYSASKAYMTCFSEALALELAAKNIRVQALCPGFTVTGFHDALDYGSFDRSIIPEFMWMKADEVVGYSLRMLKKGKVICIPGRRYRILYHLMTSKLLRPFMLRISARSKRKRMMKK